MSKKNQLRIIGGQWRGRKLAIADVPGLRPTGDRIRETLFNWLMGELVDSHCLDCFAGSGALGFECLSRGAESVVMLESNPSAAKQLKSHSQVLNTTQAQVVQTNALDWLKHCKPGQYQFDLVFIDPPFAAQLWQQTIDILVEKQLLTRNATIYIESPKNQTVNGHVSWTLEKEKIAGDVCYRLFRTC